MKIYVHAVIGVDQDLDIFPFWLHHYLKLGIPPENFLLVLHAESASAPNLERAYAILKENGVCAKTEKWIGVYDTSVKYIHSVACRQKHTLGEDWVLLADIDEFHEYPDRLVKFLEWADSKGYYAVKGPMIDRLAPDYCLKSLEKDQPLEQQFPKKVLLTQYVARGMAFKVMAHKMMVVTSGGGHHRIWFRGEDEAKDKKILHHRNGLCVNHYKWRDGLLPHLEKRRETLKKLNRQHWNESDRLLKYYEAHHESFRPDISYYKQWVKSHIGRLRSRLGVFVANLRRPAKASMSDVTPSMNGPAIYVLKEKLSTEFRVFEYGSGDSTLFFASRCREVCSVEFNSSFYDRLLPRLPANVKLFLRPLDLNGDYSRTVLECEGLFDVILVNGQDRRRCVENSLKKLKPEGVLVLEDSESKNDREIFDFMKSRGFKCLAIKGPKQGNVAETAFFYRSPNCFGF